MINRYFQLTKFINKSESVFLFGPRGTGKTKLLEMTLPPNAFYISLLQSEYFTRYLTDASLFSSEIVAKIKELPRGGL